MIGICSGKEVGMNEPVEKSWPGEEYSDETVLAGETCILREVVQHKGHSVIKETGEVVTFFMPEFQVRNDNDLEMAMEMLFDHTCMMEMMEAKKKIYAERMAIKIRNKQRTLDFIHTKMDDSVRVFLENKLKGRKQKSIAVAGFGRAGFRAMAAFVKVIPGKMEEAAMFLNEYLPESVKVEDKYTIDFKSLTGETDLPPSLFEVRVAGDHLSYRVGIKQKEEGE